MPIALMLLLAGAPSARADQRGDRQEAQALLQVCALQLKQGKPARAERSAREALEADPKSAEAYAALAMALEQSGKREDMLAALRRAAELSPQSYGPLLEAAQSGRRISPDYRDTPANREALKRWQAGIIAFQNKDYALACKRWRECLRLDSGNSDCLSGLKRLGRDHPCPAKP